jgi:predicted lysophospholipase L1 biosynthesis ABC-type transport system permease subunit
VRTALGASRRQVIGALMSEALTISVAGGLLGLALAYGGIRLLVALNPAQLPRLEDVAIDPIVLVHLGIRSGLLFASSRSSSTRRRISATH